MKIERRFVRYARDYANGSGSMLYAIASTGKLERGAYRPTGHNGALSDPQWERQLWARLRDELLGNVGDGVGATLADFLSFVDAQIDLIDAQFCADCGASLVNGVCPTCGY